MPQLAVGVLVVIGCALGALYLYLSARDTTAVLTARDTIERGELIDETDLQFVEIASDDPIATVTDPGVIVGQLAITDIAPGTIMTPGHVTTGALVDPGSGVVGLSLSLGEIPSLNLGPGDHVNVILTPDTTAGAGGSQTGPADVDADSVLVADAVVVEVAPAGTSQTDFFVALNMSEDDATRTAQAAAADRVRLVAVGADE